ncbi:hypothetical protein NJB85_02070 [Myroides odoratimimus]|uniref:hypothetical protein n=1 Tax=Myroides odoratimimus TaxID=76832 RepID=UPI002097197F|nr:hypothetical protein [Myroides odoratimimus]MCO7721963.1 hypothetical protein [Myroides odoratimimus]
MTLTQYNLAIQKENEKLKKENEIMKQIGTAEGFYDYYFKHITKYPSRIEAFNYVNGLYEKYFGIKRYRNYCSFKNVVNRKFAE